MTTPARTILVTSALPYANGPIHLGHLVEYIQTDIWVRFQRMRGNECHYVCADDAHGTPIMLRAQNEGISPQTLIDRIGTEHRQDFSGFQISFDNYYSTHSEENRQFANLIYERLAGAGHIAQKTIRQAYDPEKRMFLPDRFIKGECPRCGAADQYGDSCEVCGATYSPTDLINPRSALSGATPVEKESEHYFFKLADFEPILKEWIADGRVQEEIANKLAEWFRDGLQSWDISRDTPYWGFEIPGTTDKFFYVWLDAPIGYMASFKNLCARNGLDFDHYWSPDSSTELYHFIGKDIAYFHTLFWPAMLHGADFRKPTAVFCHGFLTVNGQKMSKSRGTFIQASTYLRHLRPEYLRYYFATKLTSRIDDIDLALDDFQNRVNSDLVNKYINIASRCAGFISKRFSGQLSTNIHDLGLHRQFIDAGDSIAQAYETREYARAMREIMALADRANQYVDEMKPWVLAKQPESEVALQDVCTLGLELFRLLTLYLKPVLPELASNAEAFLNTPPQNWPDRTSALTGTCINAYTPLLQRVEKQHIDSIIRDSGESLQPAITPTANKPSAIKQTVLLPDFQKLDLRVVRILSAEHVQDSDHLIRLQIDTGDGTRSVLAGIGHQHEVSALRGRLAIACLNLPPRKTRFGTSEAMLLTTTSPDSSGPHLLQAAPEARPGDLVC